jgi:hypothetical protein
MGFLRRLLGGEDQSPDRRSAWSPDQRPAWMRDGMEVQLYEGQETLEVVGEASYQDNLWRIVGGRRSPDGRVREDVFAVLAAEPKTLMTSAPWPCGSRVSRSDPCPAKTRSDTGPACWPWSSGTASRSPATSPVARQHGPGPGGHMVTAPGAGEHQQPALTTDRAGALFG